MHKKLLLAAGLAALLVPLGACSGTGSIYSNYREVDQLQVVQTVGVDHSGTQISILISTGSEEGDAPPVILSASGSSISRAINKIQTLSPNEEMLYDHTQYGIFGEKAAIDGLSNYFDFFDRSVSMRLNATLFVIKGATAQEVFSGVNEGDYCITSILSGIKSEISISGDSWPYTGAEVAKSLSENGAALICAVEVIPTEGAIYSAAGDITISPVGYAVLKDAELCGYLTGYPAQGANILMGHAGSGLLTLVTEREEHIIVDFTQCDVNFEPVWNGDALECIDVKLKAVANAVERTRNDQEKPDNIPEGQYLEELNDLLTEKLCEMLSETLRASRELEADFLGLNRIVDRSSPSRFHRIAERWPEILGGLEFRIYIDADVTHSYDTNDLVNVDGGGFTGR